MNMTPEEKLAEKLRLQKLQEEADLKAAMDTFGVQPSPSEGIDGMHPTNKVEFEEFGNAIAKKVGNYKNHDEYLTFLEDLVRKLCANCKLLLLNSNQI